MACPSITLILAGTSALLNNAVGTPALETLIARGSGLQKLTTDPRSPLEAWQSQLLSELSLSVSQFPGAAVSWLGAGGEPLPGTWLHATPVHMSVTLDGLSLHAVPAYSAATLRAIESAIGEHCRQVGYQLHTQANNLFLRCVTPLQVETVAAETAYRYPLRSVQPQGLDARKLNQLSTEIQMLLHEHPMLTNSSSGAPINALWLWGAGVMPPVTSHLLPIARSNEAFVKGIYRLGGARCEDLVTLDSIATDQDALLVTSTDMRDSEEQWFAPLLSALQRDVWRSAKVYIGDYQFTISRYQLWRIWRRSQSIPGLMSASNMDNA